MEIRKSNSVVSTVTQDSNSTESKKSEKSLATGIGATKDSFEVSSSSNQENSGTKQLTSAEQQAASRMNYKDFESNGNSSQDNRSRFEDARNSGLAALLGHGGQKNDSGSQRLPDRTTASDLRNSQTQIPERTSDAVNFALQKLTGGTNSRESLDQELAQRRQDLAMLGGSSSIDRLKNSAPDPTAPPEGKGNVPTGKDQLAYDVITERHNNDGTTTRIRDTAGTVNNGTFVFHQEETDQKDGTHTSETWRTEFQDNTNKKIETHTKQLKDGDHNVIESTTTTTTTSENGATDVKTSTTTKNKDGSSTTTTTETTSSGGSVTMPDPENYTGDIPDDIKKSMDYFKQQAMKMKPKTGGETVLTDGGATGNSTVDNGPVDNVFTRMGGIVGMVGQPVRDGDGVGNPSHFDGGGSSSPINSGGATDPIDGNNWTGTTHQDDPADVHFGPAEQPKEQTGAKKNEDSDSDNSKSSILDAIRFQRRA